MRLDRFWPGVCCFSDEEEHSKDHWCHDAESYDVEIFDAQLGNNVAGYDMSGIVLAWMKKCQMKINTYEASAPMTPMIAENAINRAR